MSSPFLFVGELSELLRVSPKWAYQQLNQGNIAGSFKIGGIWLIDKEMFFASLKNKAQKPNSEPTRDGGSENRHNLL
ncbi:MAG TPA: helix-turn-helix domain-containing protein [Syntrophales bacterium]|nr:helix-turn-helix domain-containing protein [Syntrophales bacterium]